ncbi:MAG: glutaredoxin domain-containing protein [Anaerolineales bacterium]
MTENPPPVIVYGTPTCPMVPPVRHMLSQAGVAYEYIDITRDADARDQVLLINDGNASVPTLVFADGSTLTEPSTPALQRKLGQFGYHIPWHARLLANWGLILIGLGVLLALLTALGIA